MITLLLLALYTITLFFVWSYVHEMSHIIAAKKIVGLEWYKIKLWPHKYNGSIRWASVTYAFKRKATEYERAVISIAPRIPGAVALIGMYCGFFMTGWVQIAWMMFWGAGVIDFIYGSIGYSEYSDLRKAARGFGENPWKLRLYGLSGVLTLGITILYFILR